MGPRGAGVSQVMPDKGSQSPQMLISTEFTWGDGSNTGANSALLGTQESAFLTSSDELT